MFKTWHGFRFRWSKATLMNYGIVRHGQYGKEEKLMYSNCLYHKLCV